MKKNISKSILIILITICLYSFIVGTPINTNDELWLFGHTYKIYNGYTLYTDINAIVPPLFFYLAYIVLSVFSFSIFGFRIYNMLLFALLFICIYKLLNALKITKKLIPIYLSLIFLFLTQLIVAGASYNILAITFITYGTYLYIQKKSTNIKQGIIIFLCFFTKQNFGIFYTISVLLYELIYNKGINIKYIKDQLMKLLSFIIPSILLLTFLYFTSNLNGFFDYCFGNLKEFGTSNFIFSVPYYLLMLSTLPFIFFIIVKVYKNKIIEFENDSFINNMNILIIFYFSILLNIYPIFNSSHFLYATPFALVIILYFLDKIFFQELLDYNEYTNKLYLIIFFIFLIITLRNFSILLLNKDNYHYYQDKSSPYKYLYIDKELYNNYTNIKNYILQQKSENNNIIIISYQAYLITNELKNNNGKYDLPTLGNLGHNGENKVINEIKNSTNTLYLILKDDNKLFFQDSLKIRNYIKDNLIYLETINDYLVYSTNK